MILISTYETKYYETLKDVELLFIADVTLYGSLIGVSINT